jgi:ribosome biogenesis GTPase
MTGRIISSVAGSYTVVSGETSVICKPKGLFRLQKISPCVGDYVTIRDNVIDEIHERRNVLVRPPLANLDCAVIVVSTCEPRPNSLIIDKLTVIFESKGIDSVLVFTKVDKKEAALFDVYQSAGFSCFTTADICPLREFLCGKTSALIGNTGAGKTSLLNRLIPGLDLPTAEISRKLGRGKHTTRTVELHSIGTGADSAVADTPGFSSVETQIYGEIAACDVALYFREFAPLIGQCRFGGCTHTGEEGCVFPEGSRHESYRAIYREAKKAEETY